MKTPKVSYPKFVRAMLKKPNLPERTVTINEKSSIQSDFIGSYPRRENPLELINHLAADVETLVEKIVNKFSKK